MAALLSAKRNSKTLVAAMKERLNVALAALRNAFSGAVFAPVAA